MPAEVDRGLRGARGGGLCGRRLWRPCSLWPDASGASRRPPPLSPGAPAHPSLGSPLPRERGGKLERGVAGQRLTPGPRPSASVLLVRLGGPPGSETASPALAVLTWSRADLHEPSGQQAGWVWCFSAEALVLSALGA